MNDGRTKLHGWIDRQKDEKKGRKGGRGKGRVDRWTMR